LAYLVKKKASCIAIRQNIGIETAVKLQPTSDQHLCFLIKPPNMKKICLTLIAAFGLQSLLSASSLYILYDESCMDRLEYEYENADDGEPYIVYQVKTSPGEKIVLEVGTESSTPQDYMPAQVVRCNNAVFDEKLVNAINSKIDQVFMVVKKGNRRYFLSPIRFAARYAYSDDFIFYDSPKYRFQFDRQLGTIGEDISYKNPKAEVTFEGKLENQCSGAFLFRQYSEYSGNPHTDLVLIPKVGIVEERSGINVEDALQNTLRLEKVNGTKLERHLDRICSEEQEVQRQGATAEEFTARGDEGEFYTVQPKDGNQPVSYDTQATQPNPPSGSAYQPVNGSLAARAPNPTESSATPANRQPVHVVQKGETLYRIAKNNNTTVAELKSANSMSSNTIYPGQRLQLPGASGIQNYSNSGTRTRSAGTFKGASNTVPPAGKDNQNTISCTVQEGDNLNDLARRYSTTVEQIRELNSLTSDRIYKGQKLLIPYKQRLSRRAPASPEDPATEYNTIAQNPEKTHIVQPGETVASIAMKYGYTEERFREINGLRPQEVVKINQRLKTSHCNCPEDDTSAQSYREARTPYPDERGLSRSEQPARPSSYGYTGTKGAEQRTSQDAEDFSSDQFGDETSEVDTRYYNTPDFTGRSKQQQQPPASYDGQPLEPGRSYNERPQDVRQARSPSNYQPPQSYNTNYRGRQYNNGRSTRERPRKIYIVKEGDTLFSIARTYGTTVEELRDINNLARNEVLIPYKKLYLN